MLAFLLGVEPLLLLLLLVLPPVPVVNGADLLLPTFGVSFADAPYFEVRRRHPFSAAAARTTTFFRGSTTATVWSDNGTSSTTPSPATTSTSSSGDNGATNGTGSTNASAAEEEAVSASLLLLSTALSANVTSSAAHVRVTQAYQNTGEECLDTRYVFTLPPAAGITAMTMVIGDRVVRAEIREKMQARQEFEEAQWSGQSAGLLEEVAEQPGSFAMELANIVPGDVVQVIVEYIETLLPIDGVFAFTFPAAAAPRYAEDSDNGNILNDTADSNLTVDAVLEVTPRCLGVDSDLPMQVSELETSTLVTLSGSSEDIIVKFWFTEQAMDIQTLVSEPSSDNGQEGYFSLAVLPPQRQLLDSTQIALREFMFVLDPYFGEAKVNGTEDPQHVGLPLTNVLMKQMLSEHLRPGDRFNIMVLDATALRGGRFLFGEASRDATASMVEAAQIWLQGQFYTTSQAQALQVGLQWAFWSAEDLTPPRSRNVVLMTSGHSHVGNCHRFVHSHLQDGNLVVVGLLPTMNLRLIRSLAEVGHSEAFLARSEAEGMQSLEKLREFLDAPMLTSVHVTVLSSDGSNSTDFQVLSMERPSDAQPDVLANRPLQVIGKWYGGLVGQIGVEGLLANGSHWEHIANISQIRVAEGPSLRLQWARSRIALLSNYAIGGVNTSEEVLQLGLEHSLLTAFTSFVAVDSHPFAPDVCGAAETTTMTTTTIAIPTTTDRYGFGSDDDDDALYGGPNCCNLTTGENDYSGAPGSKVLSLCYWLLMLRFVYNALPFFAVL